jgi:hypothetical protein
MPVRSLEPHNYKGRLRKDGRVLRVAASHGQWLYPLKTLTLQLAYMINNPELDSKQLFT